MTVTLNGQHFALVKDEAGDVVIRQQTATLWRVASARDALRVMAGLRRLVLVQ